VAVQAMPSNYERGFHSTGTIGAIGTAVAAAKLYDLGHEDTCEAIGLAVTQAAGLKGMFGTMAKPFHAGKAAFNGIMAAELAAAGFEARPDSLEMERGFFSTQTDASPHVPENYRFGDHIKKNLFKYHAACYCTHASLEAMHQILRDQEIAPDQVKSVATNVPEMHLATANIQSPETGLETKFSLKHCVVLALTGADTSAIGTYSDASANDPELMALRDRVTVNGNRPLGSDAVVEITMLDGKTHSAFYDAWIPEESLANQKEKLVRKFESLTKDRLGGGWRDASEVFLGFDRLGSVQDVFAPLMADA
jgi:2-methylcitrate dehydratase PrpD